ncbi:MAG: sugar transporter [Mucilaginibacter sp.]|nr:sugar transporter [Mucilaginibacter sp.]
MMKKLLFLTALIAMSAGAFAQIEAPVKWSYASKKISSTEAIVFLKATMQKGWHIYSLNVEDGPIKTSFDFSPSKEYSLIGKPSEPKPISHYDKNFKINVTYFENTVIFQQKIKLKSPKASVIKGKLEYETCNDIKCLPPEDLDFSIPLGK